MLVGHVAPLWATCCGPRGQGKIAVMLCGPLLLIEVAFYADSAAYVWVDRPRAGVEKALRVPVASIARVETEALALVD